MSPVAASPEAAAWDGWGTALKPAHEPIVLARAPFKGTVAANVLAHGTAALNIDATRPGYASQDDKAAAAAAAAAAQRICQDQPGRERWAGGDGGSGAYADPAGSLATWEAKADLGRWPANVLHDGSLEVLQAFPPGAAREATRFFYAAKASKEDREFGLADAPKTKRAGTLGDGLGNTPKVNGERPHARANVHPTVKPIDLMRWLCRLVTPAGGVVLDPFMGSGSTGIAAIREGFGFIGCEMDPDYFDLARRRVEAAVRDSEQTPDLVREIDRAVAKIRAEQMSLALA